MQMLWAAADLYTIDMVKPYIDPKLYGSQYPARSLQKAGATLCGASDWPVSSANPFEAISIAETRTGSRGVLLPHEVVDRMEMLKAYTIHSANALRMEKQIGSIEAGKQADFVLVDQDIFSIDTDRLKKIQVVWTMFGGEYVFKKNP
jgi:predicted amidohydrolase YtcJ